MSMYILFFSKIETLRTILVLVLFQFTVKLSLVAQSFDMKMQSSYSNTKAQINPDVHFKIANDLYVDMGKNGNRYPTPYHPIWKLTDDYLIIQYEQSTPEGRRTLVNGALSIRNYDGKAYIRIGIRDGFFLIYCAPIAKEGEKILINSTPQYFYFDNFITYDDYTKKRVERVENRIRVGVWLSADEVGNIIINSTCQEHFANRFQFNRNGTTLTKHCVQVKPITDVNTASIAAVNQYIAEQNRKWQQDSLEEEAFERKLKGSYNAVVKLQSSYKTSNYTCLKKFKEEYRYTTRESRVIQIPTFTEGYKFNDVNESVEYYDKVNTGVNEGLKNNCEQVVVILGIEVHQSPRGTYYYEDASVFLKKGEYIDLLSIPTTLDSRLLKVVGVHYYRLPLTAKR